MLREKGILLFNNKQIESSETALRSVKELVDKRLERAENLSEINENLRKANNRLHMDNSRLEDANAQAEQNHLCLSEKNWLLQAENEKLQSGNSELEKQKEKIQDELNAMEKFQANLERQIRSYEEGRQWQLPEPGAFTSAKAYRENSAKPLVKKLKELVKSLTARCASLGEQVRKLTERVKQQAEEIDWYKGKLREQAGVLGRLKEKAVDLERVRQYAGADRVQEMIDSIKEIERLDGEQKRIQRNYNRRFYR